jgi:TonB-dependent SusC/RagA subfamily outer membrane receptor
VHVLVLAVLAPVFAAQTPDTTPAPPSPDRYTIDVAALVRDGTGRTLSEVLTSQVPGLLVVPGSGLSGSGARVRFAGVRSLLADLPPLVLLDGTRIDTREDDSQIPLGGPGPSRLDDIPVEDVASVEVLRGPATSAIYGPGAAAGVILIQTKRGRSGALRVDGFAQAEARAMPARWPTNYGGVDVDNANPYLQHGACSLWVEAAGGCVQDYVQSFNPLVQRDPFGSTARRQLGLSASGGPSWGAFRVSGMYDGDAAAYDVPAVTWADDYRSWDLRGGGTFHPMRNLEIHAGVARVSSTLRLPMYTPVLGALSGPSDSTGFSWTPFFQDPGKQELNRNDISLVADGHPLSWLQLHASFGLDDLGEGELKVVTGGSGDVRTVGQRSARNRSLAFGATASDIHFVGLRWTTTVGVERLSDRGRDYVRSSQTCSPGGAECAFSSLETRRRFSSLGVYGVQQVGIGRRLTATGALRHDHIDDWKPRSQTHPSVSLDWVPRTGQHGAVQRVAVRAAYGSSSQPPPNRLVLIFLPAFVPPPPPLQPELTRGTELSGEIVALEGRVHVQAAVYDSRSRVLEFQYVSGAGGYYGTYFSGSVIGNRGMAATISTQLVDHPSAAWDLRLSIWGNRNRVLKHVVPPYFYVGPAGATGQGVQEGYPANGYWSTPLVGYSDANGDGIISSFEITMAPSAVWTGTPYPTQGAALTSSWRFMKGWRLSTTLDYRAGQTLFNQAANWRCQYDLCPARVVPTTPLTAQATAMAASRLATAYYEDADFLKLREITLSFDVPKGAAAVFGARSAAVILGGRNLATWTKYTGGDPEVGGYGAEDPSTPMAISDAGTIPLPRLWTLRVRVSY